MSGWASLAETAGRAAGLAGDDAIVLGSRMLSNRSTDDAAKPPRTRIRRSRLPADPSPFSSTVVKQEVAVTTDTPTAAETQDRLDLELQKFIDDAPTPERKAEIHWKIGMYRQDLAKQAPLLVDLDEALSEQVMEEWFSMGDPLLKRAVFNAAAGSEEIPLAKAEPVDDAETALAKMVADAPQGTQRIHLLQKIGAHTHDLTHMLALHEGQPKERIDALVKAWLEVDPGETALRKNILDAEMSRSGRAIYGTGVKSGDVVHSLSGNASAHAGTKLGDSSRGTSRNIARTIPRAPRHEGGGAHVPGGLHMPRQRDGESPSPGAGTGAGAAEPHTSKIRRKGTTGGLGSVAGSDGQHHLTVINDKERQARRRAHLGSVRKIDPATDPKQLEDEEFLGQDEGQDEGEGNTLVLELMKIAPDEMIDAIGALDAEDQVNVCEVAAEDAADLVAWAELADPDSLQKRDLSAAIATWLGEEPETIQLKKWVAEALASAEVIPLELGADIMAWTPEGPLNKAEILGYLEEMQKLNFGAVAGAGKAALGAVGRLGARAGAAASGVGRKAASRLEGGLYGLRGRVGAAGRGAVGAGQRTASAVGSAGSAAGGAAIGAGRRAAAAGEGAAYRAGGAVKQAAGKVGATARAHPYLSAGAGAGLGLAAGGAYAARRRNQ